MKRLTAILLIFVLWASAGTVRIPGPGGVGASAPAYTAFMTGVSGTLTPRNDLTIYVGGSIFMAGSDFTATQLGRYCIAGNSHAHDVYLMNLSGSTTYAHVTVTCPGTAGCVYSNSNIVTGLPLSQTLTHGVEYTILSGETNGADTWYDDVSTVSTTAIASLDQSVYTNTGPPSAPSGLNNNTAGHMYVPPCLGYV